MKKLLWCSKAEEMKVLQEAVDWALECTNIHSMAEAVDWAIAEYRWNLTDEDTVDRKAIKHKINILVAIRDRMNKEI